MKDHKIVKTGINYENRGDNRIYYYLATMDVENGYKEISREHIGFVELQPMPEEDKK